MNIVEPIRKKSDLKKIERILRKQSLRDLLLFTIGTNCGLRISDILKLRVFPFSLPPSSLYANWLPAELYKYPQVSPSDNVDSNI